MFSLNRLQYIRIIGCLVIFLGCMALVGWQFDIDELRSLKSSLHPMNPLTAIAFILSGAWLLLFEKESKLITLFWLVVTVIGVTQYIAYFIPSGGIRLDQFLYSAKIKNNGSRALMAPNTALIFALSGISMATTFTKHKNVLLLRQIFLVVSFWIAYSSLLGYIFGLNSAFLINGLPPIALFSSLVFLLLNLGLFITNTSYGFSKLFALPLEGSVLLRRVSGVMIVLTPLLGYLRLQGQQKGLYSTEYGVELHTLVFTITIVLLIYFYASILNKKQKTSIDLEIKLASNERKYRTLVDSLREGIASIDYEGKILYCNPSYCDILGYTEEELIGQVVVNMIIPVAKRPEFYKRLENRKKGIEENYETEIYRKTGEKILIDIKSRTLLDEQGKAYAYVVSINDITEEKLKIEDLKAFSASAAHDLNSPLANIQMLVDLLNQEDSAETRKSYLSIITGTVVNMRQLLHDLLEFSRLGTQPLSKTTLDLNQMVNNICTLYTRDNFAGTLLIHPLPAAYGNEGAIKQLFTNLISNAVKYSSKKTKPHVEIGSYVKDSQVFYFIKDNGVGVNEEQIKAMFTPFKRFHSGFEGNGLGLAIVKRVIEKHGGTIYAESVEGEGLSFHFTLSPDTK